MEVGKITVVGGHHVGNLASFQLLSEMSLRKIVIANITPAM
jgi:hypothetical protein